MIKVLHINAGSQIYGGVSAFCFNMYKNIDREKIRFDFLTPNISTYERVRSEIESYGGKIYQFGINSSTNVGKIRLYTKFKEFFEEHQYDVIHINAGVLVFNYVVAKACKKYTTSKIFVHSHNNGGRSGVKELFSSPLKALLANNADVLLACSKSAAEYMFPSGSLDRVHIINNGINTSDFSYKETVRQMVREEYDLQDKFVIGHIGRFTLQKNHEFLIDLFCEVKKKKSNAVLLLIGEGPLMESIKNKVKQKNVEDSVLFLGARKDVNQLYQAMDVFVLPSVFEGFGIVNVEAQTAGLKCLTSDVVPEEVNITGNVKRLSLDAPLSTWVKEVLDIPSARKDYSEEIMKAGFEMTSSAKKLELLYEETLNNE